MKEYTNIPIPMELSMQIDNIMKTGGLGYKTKSEFVKEAVREKLIELCKIEIQKRINTKKTINEDIANEALKNL